MVLAKLKRSCMQSSNDGRKNNGVVVRGFLARQMGVMILLSERDIYRRKSGMEY